MTEHYLSCTISLVLLTGEQISHIPSQYPKRGVRCINPSLQQNVQQSCIRDLLFLFFGTSFILFCLFLVSWCRRSNIGISSANRLVSAYLWLNSWKVKERCLNIWAPRPLVVSISSVMCACSKTDQWPCFMQYANKPSTVGLFWFFGLLTLATYPIVFSASGVTLINLLSCLIHV